MTKKQDEKLLDHNYDGIQELDNPLPRWWVYLFILTVIFSVFYIAARVTGNVRSIDDKFHTQLQELEKKNTPAEHSEKSLTFAATPQALSNGKSIFESKCAACHKADGGGLVGPNLTDEYWLHGGSNTEIYTSIDLGIPQKGMIAWGPLLSQSDMESLVVYINSLKGSNPSNAKGPEGEKIK